MDIKKDVTFYYYKDEKVMGPVSFEELQKLAYAKALSAEDQIYPSDIQQWVRADTSVITSISSSVDNEFTVTSSTTSTLEFQTWEEQSQEREKQYLAIPEYDTPCSESLTPASEGFSVQFCHRKFQNLGEALRRTLTSGTHQWAKISKAIWHQASFDTIAETATFMCLLVNIKDKYKKVFYRGRPAYWDSVSSYHPYSELFCLDLAKSREIYWKEFEIQTQNILSGKLSDREARRELRWLLKYINYDFEPLDVEAWQNYEPWEQHRELMDFNISQIRGEKDNKHRYSSSHPAYTLALKWNDRNIHHDWDNELARFKGIPGIYIGDNPENLMTALADSPVWREINIFDRDYPPFNWYNDVWFWQTSEEKCRELGIVTDEDIERISRLWWEQLNEAD